jgi:hypothetical protein
MLLAAFIGKIIAVATAEILTTWWKVELGNPPSAGSTIDHQRTDKPVSHPAEITGCGHQFNLIVQLSLLPRIVAGLAILEPNITPSKAFNY